MDEQSLFVFHKWTKVLRAWTDTRVGTWQHFGVNQAFKERDPNYLIISSINLQYRGQFEMINERVR